MARLDQIRLDFDPLQDRILLRVNTKERAEYRVWLTRRYTKILWGVLVKLVESDQQLQAQREPEARKAVLSFQHESALSKTDFKTVYREDAETLPLGDEPLLLSRVRVRHAPDGRKILCLDPPEGSGIELGLRETLLHSFSKLLADTARKADWDLDLGLLQAPAVTETAARSLN